MSKKDIKIICYLSIFIFLGFRILHFESSEAISFAVSIATVTTVAYDRFLWRFNPLEKTPRIFGSYEETCFSNYQGGYEYKAKAIIKQTLSSITVFEEVDGSGYAESITASLVKSSSDGIWKLYYTYRTYPPTFQNDDMHEGTVILRVCNKKTLSGVYFTNRLTPTQGNVEFNKIKTSYNFRHKK